MSDSGMNREAGCIAVHVLVLHCPKFHNNAVGQSRPCRMTYLATSGLSLGKPLPSP